MQLRGALLAAGILALPIAASAQQPVTGIYIGLNAGVNLMQDETVKSLAGFGLSGEELDTKIGPAVVGTVGWGFGNGLRTELEFDYRSNGLDNLTGPVAGSVSGTEAKYGPMVNLVYDFNGLGPVVPYIGAGIGYQWANDKVTYSGVTGSGTEGSFAYQAIVGVGVPITSAPGMTIDAEYRFMGLSGNRSYGSGVSSATLNDDYNHAFLLGIRYNFGQAPAPMPAPMAPAAAPAPAVQPARSYLVFFDWDKATLSERARQIIKEAADNSTHVTYTRIDVNGYTDTSGTPQYNMGLSIRRANAVKAELIRDGVPAGVIGTTGYGETHLLVPTGPGVREPQNRRVEIIIH